MEVLQETYLAEMTQSNLDKRFYLISHDGPPRCCEHAQDDDRAAALGFLQWTVRACCG